MATATLSTTTKAYTQSSHHDAEKVVLLKPRPLARFAGYIVLLPLLPKRPPPKPLPAEVWRSIMCLAIESDVRGLDISKWRASSQGKITTKEALKAREAQRVRFAWSLSLVCKELKVSIKFRIKCPFSILYFTSRLFKNEALTLSCRISSFRSSTTLATFRPSLRCRSSRRCSSRPTRSGTPSEGSRTRRPDDGFTSSTCRNSFCTAARTPIPQTLC